MKGLYMARTSCLGIDLESVCGGAQELRRRCEVPIPLLRMDVNEVDREVGEQSLYVQTLLIQPLHTGDRKRMAKRRQTRGPPAIRWLNGQVLAQPSKPFMHGMILQVLALFRDKKGIRHPVVV